MQSLCVFAQMLFFQPIEWHLSPKFSLGKKFFQVRDAVLPAERIVKYYSDILFCTRINQVLAHTIEVYLMHYKFNYLYILP